MKIAKYFSKKMLKFVKSYNLQKHSIASRKYTITYYQTRDEVPWPLNLDKPKK